MPSVREVFHSKFTVDFLKCSIACTEKVKALLEVVYTFTITEITTRYSQNFKAGPLVTLP